MRKKIGKRVFSIILSSLLVFQSSMTTVWAIGTENETGYQTEINSSQEDPVLTEEENQVEETDPNMESSSSNKEQTEEETQETSANIEQDNESTGESVQDEQAAQNLDSDAGIMSAVDNGGGRRETYYH